MLKLSTPATAVAVHLISPDGETVALPADAMRRLRVGEVRPVFAADGRKIGDVIGVRNFRADGHAYRRKVGYALPRRWYVQFVKGAAASETAA